MEIAHEFAIFVRLNRKMAVVKRGKNIFAGAKDQFRTRRTIASSPVTTRFTVVRLFTAIVLSERDRSKSYRFRLQLLLYLKKKLNKTIAHSFILCKMCLIRLISALLFGILFTKLY